MTPIVLRLRWSTVRACGRIFWRCSTPSRAARRCRWRRSATVAICATSQPGARHRRAARLCRAAAGVWLVADASRCPRPARAPPRRGTGVAPRLLPVPVALLVLAGRLTGESAEIARLAGSLEVDASPLLQRTGPLPYTLDQARRDRAVDGARATRSETEPGYVRATHVGTKYNRASPLRDPPMTSVPAAAAPMRLRPLRITATTPCTRRLGADRGRNTKVLCTASVEEGVPPSSRQGPGLAHREYGMLPPRPTPGCGARRRKGSNRGARRKSSG